MEKAVLNGKTNWGYVETILKDWFNKRLFTVEAVEAADLQWKNQQIQAKQQRNQPQKYYQQKIDVKRLFQVGLIIVMTLFPMT